MKKIKSISREHVIAKAIKNNKVHYDYSNTKYYPEKGQYQQIEVLCRVHGIFKIQAANHMQGRGCQQCSFDRRAAGKRMSLDVWKQRCSELWDNWYNYELCADYKNQNSVMKVYCPDHGYFEITAGCHLHGRQCSECSRHGHKQTRPSFIYILYDGFYTKLGITNTSVNNRASKISKSSGRNFKQYYSFYLESGRDAFLIEKHLLKFLKSRFDQPKEVFDGSTECFYDLDPEYVKELIEMKISELNVQHSTNITLETA